MKIAIDIDEVMADYLDPLIEFHNSAYKTALKRSDFVSFNFWEVWGGSREQAVEKVYQFYKSPLFKNIQPAEGAIEAIKKIKEDNNELFVITSRQYRLIDDTEAWLEKYFSGIFSGVFFSNNFSTEGAEIKKSSFCDRLGMDALVEDSLEYAIECLKPGRKIILFKRPWNENHNIPKEIYTVNNWDEVPGILEK